MRCTWRGKVEGNYNISCIWVIKNLYLWRVHDPILISGAFTVQVNSRHVYDFLPWLFSSVNELMSLQVYEVFLRGMQWSWITFMSSVDYQQLFFNMWYVQRKTSDMSERIYLELFTGGRVGSIILILAFTAIMFASIII